MRVCTGGLTSCLSNANAFSLRSHALAHTRRGIVTYHVYYISDEIAAGALLAAAVQMIDSIVRIGRSIEQSKKASLVEGLSPVMLKGNLVGTRAPHGAPIVCVLVPHTNTPLCPPL